MAELSEFYITDDDYPILVHVPDDTDSDDACHVAFAEAGTRLSELVDAAKAHQCDTGEDQADG
jgi:hypothetical protein